MKRLYVIYRNGNFYAVQNVLNVLFKKEDQFATQLQFAGYPTLLIKFVTSTPSKQVQVS
jgi:hypothetical protein